MIPVVISQPDALTAWVAAARHLTSIKGAVATNVVIYIASPTAWHSEWFERVDPRKVNASGEDQSDVANTIFPSKTWKNSATREALYSRYKRAHRMGSTKSWGTYFLRLVEFGREGVNQLERAIQVLNNWEKEPGTAIVFHLSSAETDRPRPLGGPCLQLCMLHAYDGRIDMTAIYRNHDYFNKAFANFVGLGRLLEFVCSQTNRKPGSLVCHSGHAYVSSGKGALDTLIRRI